MICLSYAFLFNIYKYNFEASCSRFFVFTRLLFLKALSKGTIYKVKENISQFPQH